MATSDRMAAARRAIAEFAEEKLDRIRARSLHRRLRPTLRSEGGRADREGRRLVSFSDNDYLGLSTDPRVKQAAADAALRHGAGAGASRLVTGDCPLYAELEAALAAMKGTEAALVFGSGYLANISVIPVLARPGDHILLDALSHACMHAGARLSGAIVETFRHNDAEDLRARLAASAAARKLVLTETVFSMDGDLAPLDAIAEACADHGAWMMTDDAHGFGVVDALNPAPLQMGTLSKAAGGYGGYVCGPRPFIDLLINRARGFVFTTGLPPAALGAAIEALRIMKAEPARGARALAHARRFSRALDLPAAQSAIVPVILGSADETLAQSQWLAENGFLVTAIRPPTVPAGTARLRVSFSSGHRQEDVEALCEAMKRMQAMAKAEA